MPAGRAALGLALGLVITFTGGHTATFGLIVFGGYAVLSGLFLFAATFGPRAVAQARTGFRVHAVVSLAAGIAALAITGGGIGYLVVVLSGWAILTGALELVSGIRARGAVRVATDWIAVGALTVVLGIVILVIPPDISQSFEGDKDVTGLLTSPIIVIGVLGAWAVITGVLQAISAATPKYGSSASSAVGEQHPTGIAS